MTVTFEQVHAAVNDARKLAEEFARPDQEVSVDLKIRTLSYAECKAKGIAID